MYSNLYNNSGIYIYIMLIFNYVIIETAELKPSNGKPSSADTNNGVTTSEEMIRMNLEKLKKRAAPKQPKAPTTRFLN